MKTLQEQSEIVKQRLHYHFAKVGGGWNIEGMNAPFMKEFLNEVERLCDLSVVVGQSEQLKPFHCPNCGQPWDTRLTNSCQCGASIKRF